MKKYEEQINKYIGLLQKSHNLIFHGAPGTGKTFTAKEMAAQMIFGKVIKEDEMTESEKKQWDEQFGFVQFHPSYDYTDFVEGLRPCKNDGGQNVSVFERVDGVFKKFSEKAAISQKVFDSNSFNLVEFKSYLEKTGLNEITKKNYFLKIEQLLGQKSFDSKHLKNEFTVYNSLIEICNNYEEIKFFDIDNNLHYTFPCAVAKLIEFKEALDLIATVKSNRAPFIFLIDEINRGETSKIFGELFFSIDPGYRGIAGRITTQYQNLAEGGEFVKGFYVPENVYIIGTMNDIDRSVETMDFAFRRRFAWIEIKADTSVLNQMLKDVDKAIIEQAKIKMDNINQLIRGKVKDMDFDLGESYCIGGAYFKKIKKYLNDDQSNMAEAFESLWKYHICGLITEYLRGQEKLDEVVEKIYNDVWKLNNSIEGVAEN